MRKYKIMTFKIESTNEIKEGCEPVLKGLLFHPDVVPESGELALVMVTDKEAETTKLMIRRIYYDSETITLKPDGKKADYIFKGTERRNVGILGVISHKGRIFVARNSMIKRNIINASRRSNKDVTAQRKGEANV